MKLMDELSQIRTELLRFVNRYNKLEKTPFEVDNGELLYPSEMNMIEAIGKQTGITVTELCIAFGVTKGAVSQTVSKLVARGYVQKDRNAAYTKEIMLSLTVKGKEIFEKHEQFHQKMDQSLEQLILGIPKEKLAIFREILDLAGKHLDTYLNLSKKKI